MLLGILKEQNFNRVSITPTASKKLTAMGITAVVEAGAGEKAEHPAGRRGTNRKAARGWQADRP